MAHYIDTIKLEQWIQILEVMSRTHPRYGKVEVTLEDLEQMVKNFSGRELVIDYRHGSAKETGGADGGKAAGWIKGLKVDRGKLLALPSWTEQARKYIAAGEYRYTSAEFEKDGTSPDTGKRQGATLHAVAITNRPFMDGPPIMLSADVDEADLSLLALEAKKTDDGEEYPREAYLYVPDPEAPSSWKLRIWESPSKKVTRAQLGRAAAAFSPGGYRGQKVQLPADEKEAVKKKLVALYRKDGVEDEEIPKYLFEEVVALEEMQALMKKLGLTVEEDMTMAAMVDAIAAHVAVLKEKAEGGETQMEAIKLGDGRVFDGKAVVALEAKVKAAEDANAKTQGELVKLQAERKVEGLILEKKVLPKERDMVIRLAMDQDPKLLEQFLETRKDGSFARLFEEAGGAGRGAPEDKKTKAQELDEKVKAKMTANTKLTYGEAMRTVALEDPALVEAYTQEQFTK